MSSSSFFSFGNVFFLLHLIVLCNAQTSKIFQWKFAASVSENLPTCQELAIIAQPFDVKNATGSSGVPPYYMMSFAVGGLPKTDLIGTDKGALKWTVNHPVGTSLMLSVVDSTGSAGGIPARLYTVVTGQSTTCVEAQTKSDFTVSSNVTDSLTTCQPWGLRIKGGVPPYNLTLAAVNSPIVTNVTLGSADDAFTYINRADPNTKLLAAISDFTGRWAFGTPIVPTKGSTNVDCPGFGSSSGSAAKLDKEDQDRRTAEAAAASRKRASIIAGVVVSVIVLLMLGIGGWYFFIFRKRKMEHDSEKANLHTVDPFSTPPPTTSDSATGQVLSINSYLSPSSPPRTPKSPQQSFTNTTRDTRTTDSLAYTSESSSRPTSGRSSGSRPGFAAFPRASTRGSAKAMEAAQPPSPDSQAFSEGVNGPSGSDLVFQHRDGGVVQELPPPYMNPSATPRP